MVRQQQFKEIVFLDTLANAERYIRSVGHGSSLSRKRLHIALTPTVYDHLARNGFMTHNTTQYFTNSSHLRTLERSTVMLDWLRQRLDISADEFGVKRAYNDSAAYLIRCSINYCLWVVEIALNVIDTYQPERFIVIRGIRRPSVSVRMEPEEGVFEDLIGEVARRKSIFVESIGQPAIKNWAISLVEGVKGYILETAKFIARQRRFNVSERRLVASRTSDGKGPVLLTTRFYGMNDLAKALESAVPHSSFHRMESPVVARMRIPDIAIDIGWRRNRMLLKRHKNTLRSVSISMEAEDEIFSHRGISFARPIAEKFKSGISLHCMGLLFWTIRLDRFLDAVRPSAVISNGDRIDDIVLAELCARKHVKDIFISHGSHRSPQNAHEMIEWGEHGKMMLRGPFSHLAIQTPFAEGYLASFPPSGIIVKTGPLLWGKPIDAQKSGALRQKLGIKDGMKVMLHAGTPKASNALRFNVYETCDEYIQALGDLAAAVEGIPNAVLVIRCRPSTQISIAALKNLIPFSEKVILNTDGSFLDALGMADMVVSFSSTTIEEALQNKIPVLMYGGGGRYKHLPAHEIAAGTAIGPSALYHVKENAYLRYAIQGILGAAEDGLRKEKVFESCIYDRAARVSLADLL